MDNQKIKLELKKLFSARILLVAVASTIILLCIAFAITSVINKPTEPSIDTGSIGEFCVLPTTKVTVDYKYSCGHTKSSETDAYVGYTDSMLRSIENCTIISMDTSAVHLVIQSDEFCPDHFILKLSDSDSLCVFSTDNSKSEALLEIAFDTSLLSDEEYDKLKIGIHFYSLTDINVYLENMET